MKDMTLNAVSIQLSRLDVYTRHMVVGEYLISSIRFEEGHDPYSMCTETKDKIISQARVRGPFTNGPVYFANNESRLIEHFIFHPHSYVMSRPSHIFALFWSSEKQ